jgi:glutamyl-tRNA reductase
MRLLCIGLSHRTAPLELRECVDFLRGDLAVAYGELAARRLGPEVVVLSTRTHVEIYGVVASDGAARSITHFFSEYHGIDYHLVERHLYGLEGADVARHLFRVAAGVDSPVFGESQILGQVQTAYAAARAHRTTGPLTHRLFRSAFAVGERVRTETGLGAVPVTGGVPSSGKESCAKRITELQHAEAIVAEEVHRFTRWQQSREIIPTLFALRQRFEAIRRAELIRLAPKLSALSPEARTCLDEMTRLMVEQLLTTPTEQLESVSNRTTGVRYADALNRLFRLVVEDEAESVGTLKH